MSNTIRKSGTNSVLLAAAVTAGLLATGVYTAEEQKFDSLVFGNNAPKTAKLSLAAVAIGNFNPEDDALFGNKAVAPEVQPEVAPDALPVASTTPTKVVRKYTGDVPPVFNNHTDNWFDGLVTYSKANAEAAQKIAAESSKTANQRNLPKLVESFDLIGDTDLRQALNDHAASVKNLAFKSEFKFSFSKNKDQSSAASEFYSLVNQAVTYNA